MHSIFFFYIILLNYVRLYPFSSITIKTITFGIFGFHVCVRMRCCRRRVCKGRTLFGPLILIERLEIQIARNL